MCSASDEFETDAQVLIYYAFYSLQSYANPEDAATAGRNIKPNFNDQDVERVRR